MRREIDARILIKDLASKADVARGLKTIPFGLSKDDVNQMIEFATSNFLRTVQGNISGAYIDERGGGGVRGVKN